MKNILLIILTVVILSGCLQPPNEPEETKESGGKSEIIQTANATESQEISNEEEGTSFSNDEPISEEEKELCEDAALRFHTAGDFDFTAEDAIAIDKVIRYYTCFMMCDESGKLIPDLDRYRTGKYYYEIRVPKEVVKSALQQLFIPHIDDTSSGYEDPADSNYYILNAEARGHIFSRCLSYERRTAPAPSPNKMQVPPSVQSTMRERLSLPMIRIVR